MIRQGFWSSPHHPDDPWARLLFMAMWNFADDYGVGSCSTRELLGFAFPNDRNITESDLEQLLRDIGTAYGVVYYAVSGRPYYFIPSWDTHQKVPHPSKTRNPTIDQAEKWLYRDEYDFSCDPRETLMTPALDLPQVQVGSGTKDKEKVKEKEKDHPRPSGGQAAAKKRGTRLTDDWTPPPDVKERLSQRFPNLRLDDVLQEFINYWTALPGERATKLDWNKTFINRVHAVARETRFQIVPVASAYADRALTGTEAAYVKLTALADKYSQEDSNAQLPAGRVQGDDEGQGVLAIG